MVVRLDGPVPPTIEKALWALTVEELRPLAKVLCGSTPRCKDEIILLISSRLSAGNLPSLWARLGEIEKAVISEAVHSTDGRHAPDRFLAKYGQQPNWISLGRFGRRDPESPLGVLFCGGQSLPQELQERLKCFVPTPAAATLQALDGIPTTYELPWTHWDRRQKVYVEESTKVPLVCRETEVSALHDLFAVLRLVDAEKISISDKTLRPSASAIRAVADVLHGGDFYEESVDQKAGEAAGPIKAFAWPLILQAAGFTHLKSGYLEISKDARTALAGHPAEAVKHAWENWLSGSEFDEFNRVEAIKGQSGRGKRGMTEPYERREAIADGLAECPIGRWIEVEEFFRYLRAAGHGFAVTEDPLMLYIGEYQYGNLGYLESRAWTALQARYALCFLFEYVATLGLIDVAYVPPAGIRPDFRKFWGTSDSRYLSRYDGLLYFRLNPLGVYCLDVVNEYAPKTPEAKRVFHVLPNREVAATGEPLSPADRLMLGTYLLEVSERLFRFESTKILQALEKGHSLEDLKSFLAARSLEPLPDAVSRWLDEHQERFGALRDRGRARLIECADGSLALLIANDSRLKNLCLPAGERHLVVPAASESAFRRLLRELGYAVPPADAAG
jgi:hypothetical protein